jgi:predicted dehydrogenase
VDLAVLAGARVIVCEKPLAPTLGDAKAIVERCRAARRTLVVNYTRRFTPMLDHLRREVAAGETWAGSVTGCIRYNGGLIHNGTHWIDLCRALFGDVVRVLALPLLDDAAVDPPRTIELTFSANTTVTLHGIAGTSYSVAEGEFFAASSAVRFAHGGDTICAVDAVPSPTWPGYRALGGERVITREGLRGHFLELARHAATLARDGGSPRCSGEDGVAALEAAQTAPSVHA